MNQIVTRITQQLINLLPEDRKYYRVDELHSIGFPSFFVRRIQIEVEQNLADSIKFPKTDWANVQSDSLQEAWQQFIKTARAEAYLPASAADVVIEKAATEVLQMLVQPRKNIPHIIFGADEELDYREVCTRVKRIVVYQHFGQLLPRYMRKKEIESLTRDRCALLIKNADEKLTHKYSPLNWSQMLEPLFKLRDDKIEPDLLRLFFEDREKPQLAHRFDLKDDSVTKPALIELLSSPDSLDFEGLEGEQSYSFEHLPHMQETEDEEAEEEMVNENPVEKKSNDEKQLPSEKEEEAAGSLNTGFSKSKVEANHSINSFFAVDDSADPIEENDEVILSEPKAEEPETKRQNGTETSEEAKSGKAFEGLNEETPMWMRFFSEEDASSGTQFSDKTGKNNVLDKPIVGIKKASKPLEQERKELLTWLADDKELFIENIFSGSERAFYSAIEEITSYKNWGDASKYVEKEVFKRNLINIYSEVAVNFTDCLQSYFLEKQN